MLLTLTRAESSTRSVGTAPQSSHFGLLATVEALGALWQVLITNLVWDAQSLGRTSQDSLILISLKHLLHRVLFRLVLDLLFTFLDIAPRRQDDILPIQGIHENLPIISVLHMLLPRIFRLLEHT